MMVKLALVGLPNTGKPTLFNRLTGYRRKTGNWSGVTVSEYSVQQTICGRQYQLLDLPGILSVYDLLDQADTDITKKALAQVDIIINVVDCRYLQLQITYRSFALHYENTLCAPCEED